MSSSIIPQRHQQQCPYCGRHFSVQGIGNHKRVCKQKVDQHLLDSQIHDELERQTSEATPSTFTPMDFEEPVDLNYNVELESQHFQETSLTEAWSRAENRFTKFKKETISNGIRTRFFDEPWTGNTFWEIQSSLPSGGKPLAYILYADKSRLSSFGTAKGYPVMAHCGNLPDEIRNGKNFGGGCVVGWLPIVEEEEDNKGKPLWINFKRVVWHEAFRKILGSIAQYSRSGYAFKLPNSEKVIILYPFILILSADYEEQ
ncbi:uncharacterized protein ARMOST_12431 [Armillaria ostoyae]|uniref:Uncharacterized protein n=1 Tax=Armillaria ostoyae TaxID=47428 RepID=A0A284RJZ1_ARMOS|nr:uncharacterized protein ARMOST_12431 [Armillaria ostoyae]